MQIRNVRSGGCRKMDCSETPRENLVLKALGTFLLRTLLLGALSISAQAGENPSLKSELLRLAHDWERVKLQVIDRDDQERQMAGLAQRAEKIAKQYENVPDPRIWLGILDSEQAALANENGSPLKAWGLAKRARDILETVEKSDPVTMDAGAPTTLGLLYDQVPGFPIGFGDKIKARQYLQEAMRNAPNALDVNYFYGDFLYREGEITEAIKVLEHALTLPELSNRPNWDRSLRVKIRKMLSEQQQTVGAPAH
jgi:tetratricopeptide (TPR) repeat protein